MKLTPLFSRRTLLIALAAAVGYAGFASTALAEDAKKKKKIVMVAGTPSHGPGDHEFNAGTQLLAKCLKDTPEVEAVVHLNGWPKTPEGGGSPFAGASAIFLYMDGGGGHPVIQSKRLAEIDQLMKQGVGLVCAHYAVEVPKEKGGPEFLKWIGGYYETNYSINPHWDADFKELPKHEVTRGVKPFKIKDEWYYNMRFPEGDKKEGKTTPILVATPPDGSRTTQSTKENPGRAEITAWTFERPDGGRGFGFTGGHNHINWKNDDFRKLVLNALLWSAKVDVPQEGVKSTVSDEEIKANLDPKGKK